MNWNAKWIQPSWEIGDTVPLFRKTFSVSKALSGAVLRMTALGTYEANINGRRVSDFVLAPGWTNYYRRLQVQEYDVTELLRDENELFVLVGRGWYRSRLSGDLMDELKSRPAGLLARLELTYADGTSEIVASDESWQCAESAIRFSDIYDGEVCDARVQPEYRGVSTFDGPWDTLIEQEGEKVLEHERLAVARILKTPKGETVLDFGQEVTGYVELHVCAEAGQEVRLSHSEIPDAEGNFYNENYRTAKAEYRYICRDGEQVWHPQLTFFGFRYVRVDAFPGGVENVRPENFTAIAVYSDIRRTGYVNCSDPLLNQLFSNVIWGQRCNFLDIPTDCPQRDERLGWTGDAQVFVRAAAMNYDVERFFGKWLNCLRSEQYESGQVGHMIPHTWNEDNTSAAWGDAAAICPWEIYKAYGNKAILERQFGSMKKWVDYIGSITAKENLWTGSVHFGDWLALDGDAWKGGSRHDFIASAYYAYSTSLVVRTGHILGEDVSSYEALYERIVAAFRKEFPTCTTQTEYALAVQFRLAEDCQKEADALAEMVQKAGGKMVTGFVGTPCILHALSDFGHADLAYSLLLRQEYPSWLFSVRNGATTVWEHWDGRREDGSFWDKAMNSFNHYAYGAVMDWVYSKACGIQSLEEHPGYEKVRIAPIPDARIDWMEARLDTRRGQIISGWKKQDDFWRYEITTPVETEIVIAGQQHIVSPGTYYYYSKRNA